MIHHGTNLALSVDLVEWCEADRKPALLLDLHQTVDTDGKLALLTYNDAFRKSSRLYSMRTSQGAGGNTNERERDSRQDFELWLTNRDDHHLSYQYGGYLWSSVTLRQRWRLASGMLVAENSDVADHAKHTDNTPPRLQSKDSSNLNLEMKRYVLQYVTS